MTDLVELQVWVQRAITDVAALPPWVLAAAVVPVIVALPSLRAVSILSTLILVLAVLVIALRKDPDAGPLAVLVWLGAWAAAAEGWRSRAASRRTKVLAQSVQALELVVGRLEAARERNLVVGVRSRAPEPAPIAEPAALR